MQLRDFSTMIHFSILKHLRHLSTLSVCLFSSLSIHAAPTFFKCTTANGATQYAQRAIYGQKCSLIRVDGTPASAVELQRTSDQRNLSRSAQNQPASSTAANPAAVTTTAAASVEPAQPAPASPEQCEQLNQARTTLEQGGRVYETDDKGERHHLSETERQSRLTEYQNTAKTRCP